MGEHQAHAPEQEHGRHEPKHPAEARDAQLAAIGPAWKARTAANRRLTMSAVAQPATAIAAASSSLRQTGIAIS